jgi:hypothetical protein
MSRAGQGNLTFKAALSELQCANSLVGSQIDAGMDEKDVVASKFKSFSGRFDALPTLTIAQVTELTNASNAGPWGAEQKRELARRIDAKSECSLGEMPSASRRAANQKCVSIENFVPEEKWIEMQDTVQTPTASR